MKQFFEMDVTTFFETVVTAFNELKAKLEARLGARKMRVLIVLATILLCLLAGLETYRLGVGIGKAAYYIRQSMV